MEFDRLLDRLWGFDCEVFAHDTLFVFINYKTKEEKIFHNSSADEICYWLEQVNPILMGYNAKAYDKYILQALMGGYSPEEIKSVNDYIIGGGNGWELELPYVKVPTIWDLIGCIKTVKSLKELEGNLRLDITETTIPFDLPTKWTKQEYEEVLYYCEHDVQALFPIFEFKDVMKDYKSKFIIAKLGGLDPEYALSLTDANLTAVLLGGTKKEHKDNFAYEYPSVIDKSKIPREVLDYIDDLIEHNDLDYKPKAPTLQIDECVIQLGVGGIHGAKPYTFVYDEGVEFSCD